MKERKPSASKEANLSENIFPSEPRQPLVPYGGQQLLDAGVGDEGLLLVRDRQLQTFKGLDISNLHGFWHGCQHWI